MCECAQLRDTVEDLREQVYFWKSKAQGNVETARLGSIASVFGLTHAEAWIVSALHGARGKTLSHEMLQVEHPGKKDGEERESNTVQVFICRIRKKLGEDFVLTRRGIGFYLSDAALARIDAIKAGEQ